MDENKKEKLTDRAIAFDLKYRVIEEIKAGFIVLPLLLIIVVMDIWLLFEMKNPSLTDILIFAILNAILLLVPIVMIVGGFIKLNRIKKHKFTVWSDRFDRDYEDWGWFVMHRHGRVMLRWQFMRYGNFKMTLASAPNVKLYEWSENYKMTYSDLRQISVNGSEFYLISLNGKKIYYMYPKCYFNYTGDKLTENADTEQNGFTAAEN